MVIAVAEFSKPQLPKFKYT